MDILSWEETVNFIFASFFHMGLLINERICSCRSKFFPLQVDFPLEGVCYPGKETGSHESCFPLYKWQENKEGNTQTNQPFQHWTHLSFNLDNPI